MGGNCAKSLMARPEPVNKQKDEPEAEPEPETPPLPLPTFPKKLKGGVNLGVRQSFADLGATIADVLRLEPLKWGASFAKQIMS
jgi:hypothetical protein